ncbi:type II toxin-antitoxin system RelE/ParE family toxin [Streptomyces albidoflavus]
MTGQWEIDIEPEVRDWLDLLPFRLYRRVEDKTDRLLSAPTTLGEPYSRHLGGKLSELRFELDGEAVRIPYWLAPEKRIVLLTVFRKTKMREAAEIERAHQARKVCEDEHGTAEHTYERRGDS